MRDLPNTVRAAAEPIGQIDNLTVLSTDGASEIVRTTTSNLTQASAAIENLTGVNMASVFNNALDNANLTGSDEERASRHASRCPRGGGRQRDHQRSRRGRQRR